MATASRELHPNSQCVRDYVTANDHLQYSTLPEDLVAIHITHSNLQSRMLDIRFDLHATIGDVKDKLYTHCGTPPLHQRLILKSNDEIICELLDESKMLGYFSIKSGMEIHVIDTDPFSLSRNGGLDDASNIEKYRMSEETYDKREGTLRTWMRQQRELHANDHQVEDEKEISDVHVGDRCEVNPGGRRGEVAYVGSIQNLPAGNWIGVRFDEPVGLGDGTSGEHVYFSCRPHYGAFIRRRNLDVGDYPEKSILDEDDENEI